MSKLFSLLGYSILLFLVFSNIVGYPISNAIVIVLAVLSAIFISISIIIKDKAKNKSQFIN